MEPQSSTEVDNDFLLRLLRSIAILPEEEWDKIPQKAQGWYTLAATTHNDNLQDPIIHCPGFKDTKEVVVASTPSFDPEVRKKKILKTSLKPLKKKKGSLHAIREAILLHPDWSNNEVYLHITKDWPGTKPETVAVNGSDIRHTIALAKELGLWKDENKNEAAAKEIA